MVGGAYLCFEGFEKLAHKFLHSKSEDQAEHAGLVEAVADPAIDLVAFEKDKIKGAIRTDFILFDHRFEMHNTQSVHTR
jgi:predicted DNA repair protein MutK